MKADGGWNNNITWIPRRNEMHIPAASAIAFACFQIRASKSGCIDVTIVIVFVDLVDIFTLIG